MRKVLTKVLGDPQVKILKRLQKQVAAINKLGDKYKKMSDAQLKKQTEDLKERLSKKAHARRPHARCLCTGS